MFITNKSQVAVAGFLAIFIAIFGFLIEGIKIHNRFLNIAAIVVLLGGLIALVVLRKQKSGMGSSQLSTRTAALTKGALWIPLVLSCVLLSIQQHSYKPLSYAMFFFILGLATGSRALLNRGGFNSDSSTTKA